VSTPAPVVARALAKTYRASAQVEPTVALRGVDLAFEAGTMTALMGPSGSGKSTLLHCLAGLDRPTSGASLLLGTDIARLDRRAMARFRRDHVGFVFQAYNLVPSLSVLENVALPHRLAGRPVDHARLRSIIEEVGLGERLTSVPSQLSGGQQQRVAIARVIAAEPQIVFADEPTGALDSHTGEAVLDLLARVPQRRGQCVVVATHDPEAAARCHRVVFLRDGAVHGELRDPSPETVAARLASLRTAD
jgi:putative ABC transport system ATP-binding protein